MQQAAAVTVRVRNPNDALRPLCSLLGNVFHPFCLTSFPSLMSGFLARASLVVPLGVCRPRLLPAPLRDALHLLDRCLVDFLIQASYTLDPQPVYTEWFSFSISIGRKWKEVVLPQTGLATW